MQAQTPLLQQYFQAKQSHPETLIAMRVGDFYEFYGDDAKLAASVLEITLTGREDGSNGRIPMAGVPYHAVEKYLAKLVQSGYKVGLCDQMEDPKQAKGLVKRAITRVLTPGTVLEDSILKANQNNFLAAICIIDGKAGLATLEPSTGEFFVTEIKGHQIQDRLLHELSRIKPSELLFSKKEDPLSKLAGSLLGVAVSEFSAPSLEKAKRNLLQKLNVQHLQGYGCEDKPSAVIAASMVLSYVEKNGVPLDHIDTLSTYSIDEFMVIDPATRKSLELTQNLADGSKNYTLLEVLDRCTTTMGSRLLRRWIEQPLLSTQRIKARQNSVEEFLKEAFIRANLREALKGLSDIERLVSRISTGLAGPRDLAALRGSLLALPKAHQALIHFDEDRIKELKEQISDHHELMQLLEKAIIADAPHTLREGGVIQKGYDLELDKLRELSQNGKQYIALLEQKERQQTRISNLKVGYNSVFGYYLEISKAQLSKVPESYIRKQTMVNAERFITAELKEHESAVLHAEQKSLSLEKDIFQRIRKRVAEHSRSLLQSARAIAELDVLSNLAEIAMIRRYIKPELTEDNILCIESGRHPVVENYSSSFVPNDLLLGISDDQQEPTRIMILTGPNMSGKSTYLRQTALIVLMSQIGSFVPATSCTFGICDRIFARIGAKDELALGQSTFMVEMAESANILNNATERSLVILDEVGRGTSTFDGLAIAWAMTEYLAKLGPKTMFATHYHQLNILENTEPCIANYRVNVEEYGDKVIWTHKVLSGGTDKSYGIHVARLAGVPAWVVQRATTILKNLEQEEIAVETCKTPSIDTQTLQLSLFENAPSPLLKELQSLEVYALSPIQALQLLEKWKNKYL